MLDSLFSGLFDSSTQSVIGITDFLLCLGVSLVLGLIIALSYIHKTCYSKSFVISLSLLPAVVCVVIMMVNGNIGAGVAVAGAFGLVRFRSAPGTAKEICTLFLATCSGLVAGMGYLGYALLFTVILSAVFMIYNLLDFGVKKKSELYKTIRIVIPEDLDYTGIFDDVFAEYLSSYDLVNVKTTNMGSMFKLTYDVILKHPSKEKEMLDKLRCRNGNLEISVSKSALANSEL